MTILFISRWTFFLDWKSLVKTYKLLPHTYMGEPLLWECLPHPWTMRMASFKHVISSRLLILNLHFITSFFIMMMSWRNAFRAHSILCLQDILAIGTIPTWPICGLLLKHLGHHWSSSLSSSSLCWCLEDTHVISLHLFLQDILAIGSIISWPNFRLIFE